MSPDEIDEALRQTGSSGALTAGTAANAGPSHSVYQNYQQQPPVYYNPYQPQPAGHDRDWRDWFIMAVVSGSIGYGLISLARKYLMPHLQAPNQTILEEDRDALTAKYDEVAQQLAALDQETKAVKQGIEEQRENIERSIKDVEETVKSLRENDKRHGDDMDTIKSEVDGMKESMARMFEKSKEAQASNLTDLQNELKSLKSLLVSRGGLPASSSGSGLANRPYSPYGNEQSASGSGTPPARPSIPAWQLADSSESKDAAEGGISSDKQEDQAKEI